MNLVQEFFSELLSIFLLSAPSLLLGLFLAGIVRSFLSEKFIHSYLKTPGWKSVARASVIGIPFPLCSCSVIPVGMSLRRQGASKGATSSFLVSTPEIGVDSFLLSTSLLGMSITIARILAAFVSAIVVGTTIDFFCPEERAPSPPSPSPSSCCSKKADCCDTSSERALGLVGRLRNIFDYAFITLLADLSRYLLIGFILAAAIVTFLPAELFTPDRLSNNGSLILFFLISIPTYICAAASTPIAAAFLSKGVSAGAVLVFLLAGPATNLTTVAAIRGELGVRAFSIYVLGITVVTLCIGWIVNAFGFGLESVSSAPHLHIHEQASILNVCSAIVFAALWLRLLVLQRRDRKAK